MKKNYWTRLIDDRQTGTEELFFKIRDLYALMLKHLYNDPKDIPEFRIHFAEDQRSIEKGMKDGYPVLTVCHRSNTITRSVVADVSEIENFENSYTWFRDSVFIVVDYREDGISPLQFITSIFLNEFFNQVRAFGIRKIKISHMLESLISTGVVQFFYGFYKLDINLLQTLSAMTYEGQYIDAAIMLPRFDSAGEKRKRRKSLDISFSEPILFNGDNLRQIRKLVEMSDRNLALSIAENGKIRGLTTQDRLPNECKVRIWGHLSWTITYENGKQISYYNAHYHIHSIKNSEWHLSRNGELTKGLTGEQLKKIEDVILTAFQQHHGTIIIIGDPSVIKTETKRLVGAKSATGISTTNLSDKYFLIPYITSIDGAILMDTDCKCSCIGAILDGDVVTKGTPARGSRYNSTVNYVKRRAQLGQVFVGIVFSDDGTVDAVTKDRVIRLNLRP